MKKLLFFALVIAMSFSNCEEKNNSSSGESDERKDDFNAYFTDTPPVIDGVGDDPAWEKAEWQDINYAWMYQSPMSPTGTINPDGTVEKTDDFSGRFKVVWTEDRLYILAEIIDDVIKRANDGSSGAEQNDCLELFIDENASGGARDGTNNFFAYHINFYNAPGYAETPKNVFDYVDGGNVSNRNQLRNHHLNYVIGLDTDNNKYTWEIEMKVYDDTYPVTSNPETDPVTLTDGKKIGFAVAYCDSDGHATLGGKTTRDHFIGSHYVTGKTDGERNVGYLDSTQYAHMYLVKQ